MVGGFGEVLVLDWGVALVFRNEHVTHPIQAPLGVGVSRSSVVGTPSYMPPEQARGYVERCDERSDVYSLGAILYELLTYRPPFRGRDAKRIIVQVIREEPVPPSVYRPQMRIPATLEAIVMKCLSKSPQERYQSVGELIEAVSVYLTRIEELERRFKLADEASEKAHALAERSEALNTERRKLEAELIELEWATPPSAPLSERAHLWTLRERYSLLSEEADMTFEEAERAYQGALSFYREHKEASARLAYLYSTALEEALARRESREVRRLRAAHAEHQKCEYEGLLGGEAKVQVRLTQSLPNAQVEVSALLEREGRLMEEPSTAHGVAPLDLSLPEGRALIKVSARGYAEARFPLACQPQQLTSLEAKLYPSDQIPTGLCYIPPGEVTLGGDPECSSALGERFVRLGPYAIRERLVTCQEYLNFLHALWRYNPKLAKQRAPRDLALRVRLWPLDDVQGFTLPSPNKLRQWRPQWPVFGVSLEDAKAFCLWESERLKEHVRLPTEDEWEKAARGLDHRLYPWGDRFDPTLCHMGESPNGRSPVEVGVIEADRSPYGVRDMAGLLHEFTDSPWSRESPLRVLKGASFESVGPSAARASYRCAVDPTLAHGLAGFRYVKPL